MTWTLARAPVLISLQLRITSFLIHVFALVSCCGLGWLLVLPAIF